MPMTPALTRRSALATLTLLLGGCASTQAITNEDLSSLNSIWVAPYVEVTERFYYQGKGQTLGVLGGGLVGVLSGVYGMVDAANKDEAIEQYLADHDIDIGEMAYETFSERLEEEEDRLPPLIDEPEGRHAILSLEVTLLGIATPHLFSQLKPVVGIAALMTNQEQDVLWQKVAKRDQFDDDLPTHSVDEYFDDPDVLRDALQIAIDQVCDDLVGHLTGE